MSDGLEEFVVIGGAFSGFFWVLVLSSGATEGDAEGGLRVIIGHVFVFFVLYKGGRKKKEGRKKRGLKIDF